MSIKLADEIIKEIEQRGPIQIPKGTITGEEFEKWLRDKNINKNKLTYKGYSFTIELDYHTNKLYGKIDGIKDFINFIIENIDDIEKEFHKAVDDYLAFCSEINKEPEKPI